MAGLWYEEFEVGMEWKHPITRTVTEMDNILFTALTHNPQPLHLDEEFSRENSQFGQRLVNSIFTLGLMIGVSVEETTLGTTVGNLGMTDVVFRNPVFHGDTITSYTKILDKRESRSRPEVGIVTFEHWAINQRGQEVGRCKRQGMMKKRPA